MRRVLHTELRSQLLLCAKEVLWGAENFGQRGPYKNLRAKSPEKLDNHLISKQDFCSNSRAR